MARQIMCDLQFWLSGQGEQAVHPDAFISVQAETWVEKTRCIRPGTGFALQGGLEPPGKVR